MLQRGNVGFCATASVTGKVLGTAMASFANSLVVIVMGPPVINMAKQNAGFMLSGKNVEIAT